MVNQGWIIVYEIYKLTKVYFLWIIIAKNEKNNCLKIIMRTVGLT